MSSIDLKLKIKENAIYWLLLFFCAWLPFQFALNPTAGIDLASARVFISLLFIFLLTKSGIKKLLIDFDNTTKLILIFTLLAFFSISYSQNIAWSLRKILFILSILPAYFIALSVFRNKIYHKKIIASLVTGATLLAVISLVQFFSQFIFGIESVYSFLANNVTPFFLGNSFSKTVLAYPSWLVNSGGVTYMRAVGTFPDPHMLSYYMGLTLPWAITLAITSKVRYKWFYFAALLLLFADIATFTRGGYIALIASSVSVLPLVNRSTAKKIFLSISIIFVLFFAVPHNPVSNRLVSSFDSHEGSNQARLSNWEQALEIIKNNPLGVGIGMYPLAVNPSADYRQPIYAHNLYLDIAAELGIPALIVFILILMSAFSSFWVAAKKDALYIAGVASISLFSVHSLVESPLYSVHILPVFFILLALAVSIKRYETN